MDTLLMSRPFSKGIFSLILMVLFSAILHSCFKKDEDISNPGAISLVYDGLTREYLIHIPVAYDGSTAVPIMFNFHGYGGSATDHQNSADMRGLSESENFILVYPQGALLNGFPHWNAGLDSPENKSTVDDFGFFEAMLDDIGNNYNIDLDRVYVCGYSNGGFFSYSLACYHSNKIAALGSVSGTMMDETKNNCEPIHPTAMINLHGTSDNVVPYGGGEGLSSIDNVLTYWINYNHTDQSPIVSSDEHNGTTIEHYAYINGDSSVSVEHYKIIGGDHVWFDISFKGANTNQLIWDFVSKYDQNGLR